ncbi:hypothetical protein PAXRUDRAFT_20455 [Paxillus rubicundulus Ve08.2h10]|uniref:Uncharacterized protein n=1 Tax=Paxillus rubicundulus Ve08.2h10 TaxID=930991 RepID=A0A0D0CSG6_9AGAM|nr:hypothetical protein PAXRUDRAFT_20455 [Paxillus rubicundulus Ve08.2h10]
MDSEWALQLRGRGKVEHNNGYSIRIGSTLEYLLWNVPFDVVKVKGHWASNAFLVYLH